jgi:flagellar biosynthesis protein FlhB
VADESDKDQRTEPASAQRLQRAWDEGQVAVGHDAVVVASLSAAVATLVGLAGPLRGGLSDLVAKTAGSLDRMPFADLPTLLVRPVAVTAAILGAAGLAAIIATFVQTRGGMWGNLVAPDLSKLFQPARLTRLFKVDFLVDLGLAAAKVAALSYVAWNAARRSAPHLGALLGAKPPDQLDAIFATLLAVARPALVVAVLLAAVELAVSRWRHAKKLRMTKEEAKREYREEEGDPLIRGQRKKKHREFARSRARIEVPRADALLVNPTHIAIALRYRKGEGRAPRVSAKGKGQLAEFMRQLARENGIPIVEDIPLARLLYKKVKVGREIPAQTYKAVAAILAFVYRVTGRRPDAGVRA